MPRKPCKICGTVPTDDEYIPGRRLCASCHKAVRRDQKRALAEKNKDKVRFCSRCGVSSLEVKFRLRSNTCAPCDNDYARAYLEKNGRIRLNRVRKPPVKGTQAHISSSLRIQLHHALWNNRKTVEFVADLGCSIPELRVYLESLFKPGMTWDNYGRYADQWNIDHRTSMKDFDLTNRQHVLLCCHYMNLQPLWAKENQAKNRREPQSYFDLGKAA